MLCPNGHTRALSLKTQSRLFLNMYRYNIPIHVLRSNQGKCKKKIAAAIYEYQADCDGEWGEISFDFENGTAEIIRLADWDTIKTNRFANKATF